MRGTDSTGFGYGFLIGFHLSSGETMIGDDDWIATDGVVTEFDGVK